MPEGPPDDAHADTMASADGTAPLEPTLASDGGVATDPTLASGSGAPAREATTLPELQPGPRRPAYDALLAVDEAHYDVERELGRGGMGLILIARDRRLDRPVALKMMRERASASLTDRFEREAKITARLQHPAIVPVYEAGRFPGGQPFFAMKLVRGKPLDTILAGATTATERLALLPRLIAVCDALAYAHDRRVIHRDLKPHNILVGDFGEVVVIDWGLAKDLGETEKPVPVPVPAPVPDSDSLTLIGEIMGTPAYMPPEQARGETVDERADVYALGAILYRLLSGRQPHEGLGSREVILRVQLGTAADFAAIPAEIPPDLTAIVRKAMAPRAGERYPTAKELADDLRRFQEGQIVGVHRYSVWDLARRFLRKHRAAATVGALALGLLAIVATLAIVGILRERREAVAQSERAGRERARAEERAREATRQRAALLEEQGRQEILGGRPLRGLPYLAEAYRMAPRSVALRTLLPEALRPLDAGRAVLGGHADELIRAFVTGDGERVVTVSARGAVRIWRGGALEVVIGEDTQTRVAAVSGDGKRVVLGEPGGGLTLWDGESGARRGALPGTDVAELIFFDGETSFVVLDRAGARQVDFAGARVAGRFPGDAGGTVTAVGAGGSLLAVARGGRAVIWDRGRVVGTIDHQPLRKPGEDDFEVQLPIRSLEVDAVAGRVLTVTSDDARLWSLSGRQLLRLTPEEAKVGLVFGGFSPDGTRVVLGRGDHSVHVWDLEAGRATAVLSGHTQTVRAAAWSPDGRYLATASEDRSARLWDAADGRLLATFGEHDGGVVDVGFAPDGLTVVTAGRDRRARVWDTRASRLVGGAGGAASPDAPVPAAPLVSVTGEALNLWDPASGRLLRVLAGHHGDIVSWGLDRGGKLAVTGSWDRTARLWDLAAGTTLAEVPMDAVVRVAALSPDGTRGYTADERGHIAAWKVPSGEPVWRVEGPELSCGALSPDGRLLAIGKVAKVALHDTATGHPVRELATGAVTEVVFSPDGARLAVAETQGTASIYDVATGARVARLAGAPGQTLSVAFAPDGKRLVTGAQSGAAAAWDAKTGALLVALDGHEGEVARVAFAPDGGRVVTASHDGRGRVWDAETGRILALFEGDGDPLRRVAFSADGARVLTETTYGVARIWDVRLETRSPDEVAKLLAQTRWRLVGGQLVRLAH